MVLNDGGGNKPLSLMEVVYRTDGSRDVSPHVLDGNEIASITSEMAE